jgi:hypothetical protein
LGDLTLAASERQTSVNLDYAAANRLQKERTDGDQCAATTLIIEKELGL